MAKRQPLETRRRILDAAFWEIYRNGFQGASIDRILSGTKITKGALFHHFPSKQQLGYAVVDEPVAAWIHEHWIAPLAEIDDPIAGIPALVRAFLERNPEEIVHGGCPFHNLTQEMSGIDEGFRLRLERIAAEWQAALAETWRRGQAAGVVAPEPDAAEVAVFVQSTVQGLLGAAKTAKSRLAAERANDVLSRLLQGLG